MINQRIWVQFPLNKIEFGKEGSGKRQLMGLDLHICAKELTCWNAEMEPRRNTDRHTPFIGSFYFLQSIYIYQARNTLLRWKDFSPFCHLASWLLACSRPSVGEVVRRGAPDERGKMRGAGPPSPSLPLSRLYSLARRCFRSLSVQIRQIIIGYWWTYFSYFNPSDIWDFKNSFPMRSRIRKMNSYKYKTFLFIWKVIERFFN